MENIPVIKLLNDDPPSESFFRSHEKVAEALYKLISTDGEKGRAVALFGSLGSGKSTVINLLEGVIKRSDRSKDFPVFTFDAWTHGNDPLKRSFLERLIDFYHDKKFLDKNNTIWQEELNKITRRQEDQETKSSPVISRRGACLIIFYMVTVTLASHVFDIIADNVVLNTATVSLSILGVLGFVWPLLFYLGGQFENDLSSIIVQKSYDKVLTKTIKTPDPTAIEFQELFRKIIDAAEREHGHKLTIVLDNLDRLPEEESRMMLSTLRSFFCFHDIKNVWVVVPLDPIILNKIYSDEEAARSYVEKTFSLNFYVTPPIVTSVKEYFITQVTEAFSDSVPDVDKEAIFNIYDMDKLNEEKNIPRTIKNYINDIGTLLRIWGGLIDVKTLALYSLKRVHIKRDIRSFLSNQNESLVKTIQKNLIKNEDWQRDFAAIFYGVDQEEALHVLLDSKIKDLLQNGQYEGELLDISKIHGFDEVLKSTIQANSLLIWSTELGTLANVALCLNSLSNFGKNQLAYAWELLGDGLSNVERWQEFTAEQIEGALLILKNNISRLDITTKPILKKYFSLNKEIQSNENNAGIWVDGLNKFYAILAEENKTELVIEIAKDSSADIDDDFFVNALLKAIDLKYNSLATVFVSMINSSDSLSAASTGVINESGEQAELVGAVKFFEYSKEVCEHKPIVEEVVKLLSARDISQDIHNLSWALGRFANNNAQSIHGKLAVKALKAMLENGIIYWYLNQANKSNNDSLRRNLLMLIAAHDIESKDRGFGDHEMNEGFSCREQYFSGAIAWGEDEVLKTFVNNLYDFISLSIFTAKASKQTEYIKSFSPLFKGIVSKWGVRLSCKYVLENYDSFHTMFNGDKVAESEFLAMLSKKEDFYDLLIDNEEFSCDPWPVFEYVLEQDTDKANEVYSYVLKNLQALNQQDWTNILEAYFEDEIDSRALTLHKILERNNTYDGLEFHVVAALGNKLDEMSANSLNDNLKMLVLDMFSALSKSQRKLIQGEILDKVIKFSRDDKYAEMFNLMHLFGTHLNSTAYFKKPGMADDFLTKIILKAISANLVGTLNWIVSIFDKTLIIKNASKENIVLLEGALNGKLNEFEDADDAENQKLFKELLDKFSLNRKDRIKATADDEKTNAA